MLDEEMTPGLCVLAVPSAAHFSDCPNMSMSPVPCYKWLRMHLIVIKSNSLQKALWKQLFI